MLGPPTRSRTRSSAPARLDPRWAARSVPAARRADQGAVDGASEGVRTARRRARGVRQGRLGALDRDHRLVEAAPADVGHDDHEPARIRWQPRPRRLLRVDRLAHLLGDLAADRGEGLVEAGERLVVGLVAVEPLVQDGHVDRRAEPVPERPALRDRGGRLVEGLDRGLVLRGPALFRGHAHQPIVLGELGRQPARRRGPDRELSQAASRPSVAAGEPGTSRAYRRRTSGETWRSASGARTYGTVARSPGSPSRGPRSPASSASPLAIAASTVSGGPLIIAARAPRACVPSSSTSSASACRSASAASSRAVTAASFAYDEARDDRSVRAGRHRGHETRGTERDDDHGHDPDDGCRRPGGPP